jgi:hypothetical protein
MSEQTTTPTIPTVGDDRRPVQLGDPDADRLGRALAFLETPPSSTQEAPSAPPAAEPQADAPEGVQAAQEPAAPPAEQPAAPPELLARLAQLEAQLQTQQQSQAERQLTEREERIRKYEEFERTLREKDALAALQQLGVSFDDLSRAAVEGRGVEAQTHRLQSELQALRQELTEIRAEREREQRAQLERQAWTEIDGRIAEQSSFLASFGERARREVWQKLEARFTETGGRVILPLDQAISEVEREWADPVQRALADERVRSRFLPQSGPSSDPAAPVNRGTPTLTNAAASAPALRADPNVPVSDEDRLQRALRHLE